MEYQIGRVYKICKGEQVSKDTYIFITGMEDIEGLKQDGPRITFNYLKEIGRKAYIYKIDLNDFEVELIS